jgi:hypothetical protein
MLETLPKFHRQTQLLISLIPIQPQTSTIHQVTPEALHKFHFFKSLLVGGDCHPDASVLRLLVESSLRFAELIPQGQGKVPRSKAL